MIFFAGCKINLGLDILSRREDGFHDIETVMVPVRGLCDMLEIVPPQEKGIEFTSSGIALDCPPEKNIALRACNLMASRYGIGGMRIHLHKVIPFGAGLGGGSSDAAFAIKGINKVFGLGLRDGEMEPLAAELGSDAAFFIKNVTRFASGRGEILSDISLPQLSGKRLFIVKPDINVSTAEAYAGVIPAMPETPLRKRLAEDIGNWENTIKNDFERHIFAAHPVLALIKERLYGSGAKYASMSGSGAAIFALFDAADDASNAVLRKAAEGLRREFGDIFMYQEVIGAGGY